jgi:hypothetical protein
MRIVVRVDKRVVCVYPSRWRMLVALAAQPQFFRHEDMM